MKESTLLKVVLGAIVCLALVIAPHDAFAQRGGGHMGGGGFHGGGFGGFHGGGFGGVRGGPAVGGFRGSPGFYGRYGGWGGPWRGPYWGYPRYGYGFGWGLGLGFGFGYPYYGYYPYYPYYYPYSYAPCSYPYSYPCYGAYPAPYYYPNSYEGAANADPDNSPSDIRAGTPVPGANGPGGTVNEYRAVDSDLQKLPMERRRIVQNAISTLRAMPPSARQRQFDSGRFSNFSPEELQLVKNATTIGAPSPQSTIRRPQGLLMAASR